MTRDQRAPKINLPLAITLTNEGQYFLNKKRSAFGLMGLQPTKDPARIILPSYPAKSLQGMIHSGYVSQIEIVRTDFNSKREELLDIAKLISYSVLRNDYTLKLAKIFNAMPIVRKWNRQHPTRLLTLSAMVGKSSQEYRPANQESLHTLMRGIIRGIFDNHGNILENLSYEDEKILRYKAEDCLDQLNSLVWGLVLQEKSSAVFQQIIANVQSILWEYLQKTDIAEYLGLLILELASMAEKSLMQKAVSTYLQGKVGMEHFMRNERDRRKILAELQARNERASLIWRLVSEDSPTTDSKPFYFIVSNQTSEAKSIIKSLEGKKNLDTVGRSLGEFYEEQGEQDLGFFYLNYLKEECHKQGTLFNSYASKFHQQALSFVTLSVRF